MDAVIINPADAVRYIMGGKGKVTLVSQRTGTRYTYKMSQPKGNNNNRRDSLIFVKLLTGPDNQNSYTYLGYIKPRHAQLHAGSKGQPSSVAFRALRWALDIMSNGVMPEDLEVWHSGTCGACGRELTVPESIASGMGPVCAKKTLILRLTDQDFSRIKYM